MKKVITSAMVVLAAGMFIGAANLHDVANSDGKTLFKDAKCDKCHSIESQGIERTSTPPGKLPPDLSGVGLKHNADWIKSWLLKEEELNGKKHLKKYTGSEADLTTLAKWLASLKKK